MLHFTEYSCFGYTIPLIIYDYLSYCFVIHYGERDRCPDIHWPALHKRVQGGQPVFPAIVCVGDRSSCKTLPLYSHMFQPPHTHTHKCTQTLAWTKPSFCPRLEFPAPALIMCTHTHILWTAVSVLSADPHLLLSQQKGGCVFEVHSFTISRGKENVLVSH